MVYEDGATDERKVPEGGSKESEVVGERRGNGLFLRIVLKIDCSEDKTRGSPKLGFLQSGSGDFALVPYCSCQQVIYELFIYLLYDSSC